MMLPSGVCVDVAQILDRSPVRVILQSALKNAYDLFEAGGFAEQSRITPSVKVLANRPKPGSDVSGS